MIIDLILDRVAGVKYNPEEFYSDVMCYDQIGWSITQAMDYGEEKDVKKALCDYILENEYNPKICDFINSVSWLKGE